MKKIILSIILFTIILSINSFSKEVLLRIGMQDEPKTLNPLKASDVWSWNVLDWFHERLYIREPITHKVIPWIADGYPEYKKGYAIVKLKKGIKWEDGTEVTAYDAKFTADVILEFKIPRYYSDWEYIEKVEVIDKYTLKYYIKYDCTPLFLEQTMLTIVLPKKKWQKIVEEARKKKDPLNYLTEYPIKKPFSSGPFIFEEWRKGAYIKLKANKNYSFKGTIIQNRVVGPFYDGILFKLYGTLDAAIMALKKGEIDYIWWPIEPGFVDELKREKGITITSSPDNGFFYLAFNFRKKPFNDLAFRQAFAYLVDKEFIVKRILQNDGLPAYTVVPPGNSFWFNENTEKYGAGLPMKERIKEAKRILREAGYKWDKNGNLLYPDGSRVKEFDILTPPADYDPLRAAAGTQIQEWVRAAGIPAIAKPTAFGTLIQKVGKERDFDAFILGWRLTIDPDYVRVFFHSKEDVPDGHNYMGYRSKEFDNLADKTVTECDREKRRKLIFKCQEMLMRDLAYIPLYFRNKTEAYNNKTFTGWFTQLGGIAKSMIYLKPIEVKEKEREKEKIVKRPRYLGSLLIIGSIILLYFLYRRKYKMIKSR